MAGRVYTIAQPRTDWLKRVASRLLAQSPQMTPLEAVRRAMDAFPDSQHDDPDAVAASLMGAQAPAARTSSGGKQGG
jgi:hypothetical protein